MDGEINLKLNKQLVQINLNFVICFIVTAVVSLILPKSFPDFDNYPEYLVIDVIKITTFFGIFSVLFYLNNRLRFKQMERSLIRRELIQVTTALGIAVIPHFLTKWIVMYYFLTLDVEPFDASMISSTIAAAAYMITVTIILRKTKTFGLPRTS